MPFKAVLFDLDGTLLDTLEDLAGAVNQVLTASGWPTHPVDAYRFFIGEGVEKLVERAVPEAARVEPLLSQKVAEARAVYLANSFNHTRPYRGIPELLAALPQRGLLQGILTNKPQPAAVDVVAYYFGGVRFHFFAGARPDLPKKPDPAGAFLAGESFGCRMEEILYLGDTATDMQTAVAAGMYGVGVSWGFRPVAELVENGARRIVDHPREVLSLLD